VRVPFRTAVGSSAAAGGAGKKSRCGAMRLCSGLRQQGMFPSAYFSARLKPGPDAAFSGFCATILVQSSEPK